MANWEDVDRLARQLPEVSVKGRSWMVLGKSFAWDRPLRKRDLEELGDGAPEPPIIGVWVSDLFAKEALLQASPGLYFTTSHFDGYAIVLVRLAEVQVGELEELLVESWLRRAPAKLASTYLDSRT